MGAAGSIQPSVGSYPRIYETVPDVGCRKSQFQALQLKESEVGQLYKAFLNGDTGHVGILNAAQLISYLKSEKNDLVCRILSSFKNGLRFEGSVFEIWNICTLEETNLASFVYNLYDVNSVGVLGPDAAKLMLEELYGESFLKEESRTSKSVLMKLFGSENITNMKKEIFEDFTRRQSKILSKAVAFRKSIRSGFVYKSFWTTQANKRKDMDKPLLAKIHNMRIDIVAERIEELRVKKTDSLVNLPQFEKENDDIPLCSNATAESSTRSLNNDSIRYNHTPGNLTLDRSKITEDQFFNIFEAGKKAPSDVDPNAIPRENEYFLDLPESDQICDSFRDEISRRRNNLKVIHRKPSKESDRKAELLNPDDSTPLKKERQGRSRTSNSHPETPPAQFFSSIFSLFSSSNDLQPLNACTVESSSRHADANKRAVTAEEVETNVVSSMKSDNNSNRSQGSKKKSKAKGIKLSVSFDTNTHVIQDSEHYLNRDTETN